MKTRSFLTRIIALVTLASGLINIQSVISPSLPERLAKLEQIFPLEFAHLARFLTLLIGFALVVSSINIFKRKKRAFYLVSAMAALSVIFHLTKGLDYEEATVSLVVLALLIFAHKNFTVKSSIPSLKWGLLRLVAAATMALGYGVAGFWYLDHHQFGITFHWRDAIAETLKYLALVGDPRLIPHTHYAAWFLDSLYVMTVTALVYSLYALYRPVLYQFRTHPHESHQAKAIVAGHGRSGLDYFKYWPDKSYFFSPTQDTVIAYRVGNHFAIALADPVGPEDKIEEIVRQFMAFCDENDWDLGFHQTLPDFLPIYEKLGFRKLKIGDSAIIDLSQFNLAGKERKEFRYKVNKMEASGIGFSWHEPPITAEILSQLKEVSDQWLQIPGRRERQFTLGLFDEDYVKATPIVAATDTNGRVLAFVNIIPSYRKGEATIDLMRRRTDAPNGIMDYLFIKLFLRLKELGYQRFDMGMAPMSGIQEEEEATIEEKAIQFFFQHLNFFFSYRGLWQYKAKFANSWEPRYSIYKSPLDLPKMALALREVSEIKG